MRIFLILLLALSLSACGDKAENVGGDGRPTVAANTLFKRAEATSKAGKYREAAKLYKEIERQYPYANVAAPAKLNAAHALYKAGDYVESRNAAERFIRLHPGNKDVAYAHHLKALSYYDQITDVGRDQKVTKEAQTALEEVIRRFPQSTYAKDARLKLDLVHDQLAGKEMDVGRWYQKKKHHLAALNRFRSVVEDYQTTRHIEEALHRLTEVYLALGLNREAQNAAAVLGHNFPGSQWYRDNFALLQGRQLKPEFLPGSWLVNNISKVGKGIGSTLNSIIN